MKMVTATVKSTKLQGLQPGDIIASFGEPAIRSLYGWGWAKGVQDGDTIDIEEPDQLCEVIEAPKFTVGEHGYVSGELILKGLKDGIEFTEDVSAWELTSFEDFIPVVKNVKF